MYVNQSIPWLEDYLSHTIEECLATIRNRERFNELILRFLADKESLPKSELRWFYEHCYYASMSIYQQTKSMTENKLLNICDSIYRDYFKKF